KDDLIRTVWPDTVVEENNLNQHISSLRKVLGEDHEGKSYIETIPRRGYRFAATVTTRALGTAKSKPEELSEALLPTRATGNRGVSDRREAAEPARKLNLETAMEISVPDRTARRADTFSSPVVSPAAPPSGVHLGPVLVA